MAALRCLVLALTLLAAAVPDVQPARAQAIEAPSPLDRWQGFITEASRRFGVPEAWIRAVMRAESGGRTMFGGRPITSHAGAMGLMQIMPETWQELRGRYGFGADPYDPHDNIVAGTAYLRELYDRYGYPNLFAAYNAGPARFDAHLLAGKPLPPETLAYLASLGQPDFAAPRLPAVPSGTGLFFSLYSSFGTASILPAASSDGLFVPLGAAADSRQGR